MQANNNQRRSFMKRVALAAAAVSVPWLSFAQSATNTGARAIPQPASFFGVSIRSSLFQKPTSLMISAGEPSGVIRLAGRGSFRVEVVPYKFVKNSGQSYTVRLLAANGKELSEMNIGGEGIATFAKYGIQIGIMAFTPELLRKFQAHAGV